MTIEQLQYFIAISETKSFSVAAEFYSISQSALSKQIKNLEDELKIQLINRSHRNKICLTFAGEEFELYARKILDSYYDSQEMIDHLLNLEVGEITIATIPVISQYNLSKPILDFMAKYPELKVKLIEEENDLIVELIRNNQLDMAIIREELIPTGLTSNYLLSTDELHVILNKNHPLATKEAIDLKDLALEEFIFLNQESGLQRYVTQTYNNLQILPNIRFRTSRIETITSILEKTNYVSLLMKKSAQPFINDDLKSIPLACPIVSRLVLAIPLQKEATPATNALKKLILEKYPPSF